MEPRPSRPPLTVYFDGACPLCIREIALVRALAPQGAIAFVDVAGEGAPCPIDREALLARFHVQTPDGRLLSGAQAFAAMWRRTPILWPLGALASLPGLSALFEAAYRRFLRVRPRLQRLLAREPDSTAHR